MKKLALAVLLAGFAGTTLAQAQTTTTTTTTTIEPAWRTEMKEYVVKERRAPAPPPPGFTVSVGAPLPPPVALYSFPPAAPYAKYRYTVVGDDTVIVDPTDRRVVEVLR
jgi:Ni/Co efflux regulator RcnB